MDIIIPVALTVVLLMLGFSIGTITEYRHFKNLQRREQALNHIVQTQNRIFLAPTPGEVPPAIICCETAIASDYFKNFLAAFRKLFGGEMRSYHSLMVRARRETLTKMLEQANLRGYNAICNVRLETADVGGNFQKKGTVMVCMLGTATAYHSKLSVPQAKPVPPQKPVK